MLIAYTLYFIGKTTSKHVFATKLYVTRNL